MITVSPPAGETLDVRERLILSPTTGVFEPRPPTTVTTEGEIVYEGDCVGTVTGPGVSHDVRSGFTGFLMGLLAHPGERVRAGQPVAWVRT